jgi:tRNA (cytidine/uridine-2'-O-)-methyltransferase
MPSMALRRRLHCGWRELAQSRLSASTSTATSVSEPLLNVVLFEPQIPPNTGTIGRLTLATRSRLHLIKPNFSLDDKALRRAGMDYWSRVDCMEHEAWEGYVQRANPKRMWLFTTHGARAHWSADFRPGDHLVFGNENHGAPQWLHESVGDAHRVCLPMSSEVAGRSLNLACSVSCAVYEALRQINKRDGLPSFSPS